ncbi:MAG: hypothetical protein JXM79_07290 [Sedimentisphaerales bacterium]|nr:hypothetical protein [Sedimentisphaerales bacterium]
MNRSCKEKPVRLARSVFVFVFCLAGLVYAESLTLPLDRRPDWLQRDGIVMAGSWEPLLFRVRRDGSDGYTPTAEQRAAYTREHSPEMIAELKALGVNFIMMHCYKGAGLEAERQSMADAVRFASLCRDAGLRVGVYNYSGAFLWEPLFKETPQARDWVLLNSDGSPLTYGSATYRYRWNRNHPDAQAFYRQLVRFAVQDIQADLLHFDNYGYGPGWDANSIEHFRDYLKATYTVDQLKKMGVDDVSTVQPPIAGTREDLLQRAWLEFCCRSLAGSYYDMNRYARSLRKDILIECNPGGPGNWIRPPVDHGRLLQGGEAFWDEGRPPAYTNGQLHSRIRTYKVARRIDNIAFAYATRPLEMAEMIAFNRDCLGCICWFEYGKIVAKPGSNEPVSKALAPFIRFFHERRDLLRGANVIADVAVLRSFPSQVFADPKYAQRTYRAEQALIENRMCFQIIYDHHLNDLARYPVLVLAGCVALSDPQVEQIKQYVESGGRLCIVGPVATHDEWMFPREKPALDNLPNDKVIRIDENGDMIDAIGHIFGERLSVSVQAQHGLCSELTEQPGRRLVHLVNYRDDGPVKHVSVKLRLPDGRHVKAVMLVSPERKNDLELDFQEQTGIVTFSVPQVETYGIAVVTIK